MRGVTFFPCPVHERVNPSLPFSLSLRTLHDSLPPVCLRTSLPSGCVSAPNRLPPVGVGSTPPPRSRRLRPSLPAFLWFVFLSLSPPHPHKPSCSLCLWTPLFPLFVDPHIPSLSLRNPQADHPYSSLPHFFSVPFPLQTLPLFCLSLSVDALSPSPHRSPLSWVIYPALLLELSLSLILVCQ